MRLGRRPEPLTADRQVIRHVLVPRRLFRDGRATASCQIQEFAWTPNGANEWFSMASRGLQLNREDSPRAFHWAGSAALASPKAADALRCLSILEGTECLGAGAR